MQLPVRMAAMLALAVLAAWTVGEPAPTQKHGEEHAGVCLLQRAALPPAGRRSRPEWGSGDSDDLRETYRLVGGLLDRLDALSGRLHSGGRHRIGHAAKGAHSSIGVVLTQLRQNTESIVNVTSGDLRSSSAIQGALLEVLRPAEELQKGLDNLEGMLKKADGA